LRRKRRKIARDILMKKELLFSSISALLLTVFLVPRVASADDFPVSMAPGEQVTPTVAWGDSAFMVVWVDYRSDDSVQVCAQVVNETGELVGYNIGVSPMRHSGDDPAITYGHGRHLVVYRGGPDSSASFTEIYGQYVSDRGVIIDTAFEIGAFGMAKQYPAVACGDNYLVVWDHWDTVQTVSGQLISPDGMPVGSTFVVSTDTSGHSKTPKVAHSSIGYLVVWGDPRSGNHDIYGQLVSDTEMCIDTNFRISLSGNGEYSPDIASNGHNYLVVWEDDRDGQDENIYGQIVSSSGELMGQNFSISASPDTEGIPTVASQGNNYLVAWHKAHNGDYDIYGQWVSSNGTLLDTGFAISCSDADEGDVALDWSESHCLTVWTDNRNGSEFDIYANADVVLLTVEENLRIRGGIAELHIRQNPVLLPVTIHYEVSRRAKICLKVYDTAGRLVRELVNEEKEPGRHEATWNAEGLPAGVYFARFEAGDHKEVQKLILMQ
jgi:hypothetical protein